jgi:dienelactone hydrolase
MKARCSAMFGMLLCASVLAAQAIDSRKVSIPTRMEPTRQLQLPGVLYKPSGDGPFPALILLYGSEGYTQPAPVAAQQHAQWVERLVGWGYVALELDSHSPRGSAYFDSAVTYGMRGRDSYAAKSYLATLPFVDAESIGVIGWSHGAMAILTIIDTAFAREKSDTPFKAAVAFYPICRRLYILDTPLLILTGRKDQQAPVAKAESLERDSKAADWKGEFSMAIYPNATHAFDFEGLMGGYDDPYGHHMDYDPDAAADAIARTKAFFAQHLGARH